MKKKALITGIFGQDGSYLTELLFEYGYEVHGIVRTPLSPQSQTIKTYLEAKGFEPRLHTCKLSDPEEIANLVKRLQPEECYHLAATHFSSQTRAKSGRLGDIGVYSDNVQSALNILSAFVDVCPESNIVLAGSCLMFSGTAQTPQNEMTRFTSNSLYGLSKISTAELGQYFRSECGLRVSTAILYNHESPRRPTDFVTKKIVSNLKKLNDGVITMFELDNLYAFKDWGYARDYANGMRLMGKCDIPQDFILATGKGHTVEAFVEIAAERIGITDWRSCIQVRNASPFGKLPVPLVGDSTLAIQCLGWEHTLTFEELVALMIDAELRDSLD